MTYPREQNAGIEDSNVDIRVTVLDQVPNRTCQAPKYHSALQEQQSERARGEETPSYQIESAQRD